MSDEIAAFSHLAIGVPDIEAAARFYAQVFGFEPARGTFVASGEDMVRLLEVPDADLEALFMRKDGLFIELLRYENSFSRRELPLMDNEYGYVHLSFRVTDLKDTLRKVEEIGQRVERHADRDGDAGRRAPNDVHVLPGSVRNRIELINHLDLESVQGHREFLRVEDLDWATRPLPMPGAVGADQAPADGQAEPGQHGRAEALDLFEHGFVGIPARWKRMFMASRPKPSASAASCSSTCSSEPCRNGSANPCAWRMFEVAAL